MTARLLNILWSLARRLCRQATFATLSLGLVIAAAGQPAQAAGDVTGVWLDHTGRGAVEISRCGQGVCGRIVWMQNPLDPKGKPLTDGYNPDKAKRSTPICGLQIIGDVKPQRDGSFDQGWIYDPEEGKQYDVEVRLRSGDKLQILGYLGMKFLGETYTWTRAPASLQRCKV